MNTQNFLSGIVVKNSIPLAQRAVAAAVTNGSAIDITGVEALLFSINATARVSGSVKIQDIQFANDSSFAVNLITYTSDDYLNKNNSLLATSAIDQTSLAAAGSAKISLTNLAKNGQKFARVRTVASAGASDLTFEVQAVLDYADKPKIQA